MPPLFILPPLLILGRFAHRSLRSRKITTIIIFLAHIFAVYISIGAVFYFIVIFLRQKYTAPPPLRFGRYFSFISALIIFLLFIFGPDLFISAAFVSAQK